MNFQDILPNKPSRIILVIAGSLLLVYAILRMTLFEYDPLLAFFQKLYHTYLIFPEAIANLIFKAADSVVYIKDHQLIFERKDYYYFSYLNYIENWQEYLLHKRWSILILFFIWINYSPVRKKLFFSLVLLLVHIITVVGGLCLIGILGPRIINEQAGFFLVPTQFGNLILFTFLLLWVFLNKSEIRNTILKFGVNISFTNKRIHEVLILLFIFFILRDYLIPFFAFKPYVNFLLGITQIISFFLGFSGYVDGAQLIGENGALALAKHCLGIMTMYLFAALIYLTRPKEKSSFTWKYLLSGLILIFISNIIRLVLVFVVAQGENGFQKASMHHEIYNVGIYVFIFGMWVLWVELLRRKVWS